MIAICNCNGGSVRAEYLGSLLQVMSDSRVEEIGLSYRQASGLYLPHMRDALARQVLESGEEWMLVVDSDMVFTPDDIVILAAEAVAQNVGVIGGMYLSPGVTGALEVQAWHADEPPPGHSAGRVQPDARGLVKCRFVGSGFMLVRRDVLEAVWEEYGVMFDFAADYQLEESEDIVFCDRARACGFSVWLCADVRLGHAKTVVFTP